MWLWAEILTVCHFAASIPLPFFFNHISSAQTTLSHNSLCHGMSRIKVMLRPRVADGWVVVKSNNVARVQARSSLVGLWGSGWGHVQQAAPLEVYKTRNGSVSPSLGLGRHCRNPLIYPWPRAGHPSRTQQLTKRRVRLPHVRKRAHCIDSKEFFPEKSHYAAVCWCPRFSDVASNRWVGIKSCFLLFAFFNSQLRTNMFTSALRHR